MKRRLLILAGFAVLLAVEALWLLAKKYPAPARSAGGGATPRVEEGATKRAHGRLVLPGPFAGGDDASTFPVLVFSDIHFNPFYDPLIFAALVAASARGWAGTAFRLTRFI